MFELAPISPSLIILLVGVFAGAFVAGFAGFGLAAAAGAFLLHAIDPKTAVPLMMMCSVLAQSAGLLYLRKTLVLAPALPFIAGGILGLPIAIAVFRSLETDTFRSAFGLFLVLYAAWSLSRQFPLLRPAHATVSGFPLQTSFHATKWRTRSGRSIVGFLAGIVGGLTAMPGALLSVWADATAMSKVEQRSFVQPFILIMQIAALAMMVATPGALNRELIYPFLLSLLPLALGTGLGLFLFGRADARNSRRSFWLSCYSPGSNRPALKRYSYCEPIEARCLSIELRRSYRRHPCSQAP